MSCLYAEMVQVLEILHHQEQGPEAPEIIEYASRPGQNGRHLADNIFRCIFLNENICILIKISLKLVPIDNNPALV